MEKQLKYFFLLPVSYLIVSFGFTQISNDSKLKSWEEKFREIPKSSNLDEYMKILTARPHHVGSDFDKKNAEWILSKFKEWGFDAHIETFNVLFPTPKERLVEMISPTKFTAKLQESPIKVDPTSSQTDEQLLTYNAYSIDGDVTGKVVYVNYGIPSDYEYLERLGISVKEKIVIARYGASWRGIKPKVAAEHGAIGCLIYSDPRDDGYFQGDAYPKGPWHTADAVQRGSVIDAPQYAGDPLTPGVGATKDAKRLKLDEVKVFTKIPVLPISYNDALPILSSLDGPVAPENWRGALPITYHIGSGPAKVHMKISSNWDMKKIYDVIAKISGSEFPDEWIIRGNHHDAWVNGAKDPVSGLSVLLEEARSLGELLKQGWKPKRTVIYCAWDGEEEGLLGSTEWVEEHADELSKKTAIYINTDGIGRGFIGVSGSHSLEHFISDVTKDITDPETNLTIWKRKQLNDISNAETIEDKNKIRQRDDFKIGALGTGSDYTAFLDFLGIASLNLGFGGEGGYGVYHSVYDDYYWYKNFGDPDFEYGKVLAQTIGTAIIRFNEAEILPYTFVNLSSTVKSYLDDIKKSLETMRENTIETNKEIDEGIFEAIADPRDYSLSAPKREDVAPYLNFAPLENAITHLETSAKNCDNLLKSFSESGKTVPEEINKELIQTERKLILPAGLPDRSWYKHQIYALGFYTGYGVKTLPAVRESIELENWDAADRNIVTVANVIEEYSNYLDSISSELENEMN